MILPPTEYDRYYEGDLTIRMVNTLEELRAACNITSPFTLACAFPPTRRMRVDDRAVAATRDRPLQRLAVLPMAGLGPPAQRSSAPDSVPRSRTPTTAPAQAQLLARCAAPDQVLAVCNDSTYRYEKCESPARTRTARGRASPSCPSVRGRSTAPAPAASRPTVCATRQRATLLDCA